jgi:hypothetical protein
MMKQYGVVLVILLALPAGTVYGQVATVPVRLDLATSAKEIPVGKVCNIRVELKNLDNKPTPALEDVRVTLTSTTFPGAVTATVPKGQTGATVSVVPTTAGLGTVEGTSSKLARAHLLIAVRPEPTLSSAERESAKAAAPPPPLPPPSMSVKMPKVSRGRAAGARASETAATVEVREAFRHQPGGCPGANREHRRSGRTNSCESHAGAGPQDVQLRYRA